MDLCGVGDYLLCKFFSSFAPARSVYNIITITTNNNNNIDTAR